MAYFDPGDGRTGRGGALQAARRGARIAILTLATVIAASATPVAAAPSDWSKVVPANLPVGWHKIEGRTITISLPFRSADYWLWVGATDVSDLNGLSFINLDIEPKAGPAGTDLAIFTYIARLPTATTLRFGLVPAGKTLIGPPKTRHLGEIAKTYVAEVVVK